MKTTYQYLNQKREMKKYGGAWTYVDFTDAGMYDFLAADTLGDNKSKYKDWVKLLMFGVDDVSSPNAVFNGMSSAEWFKHGKSNWDKFDDLNDEYIPEGRSRELKKKKKTSKSNSKKKSMESKEQLPPQGPPKKGSHSKSSSKSRRSSKDGSSLLTTKVSQVEFTAAEFVD